MAGGVRYPRQAARLYLWDARNAVVDQLGQEFSCAGVAGPQGPAKNVSSSLLKVLSPWSLCMYAIAVMVVVSHKLGDMPLCIASDTQLSRIINTLLLIIKIWVTPDQHRTSSLFIIDDSHDKRFVTRRGTYDDGI